MARAIRTALTIAETNKLKELAQNNLVYEAGALLGHSTIALASTARHVISVDPHEGYPAQRPRPTWEQYLKNLHFSGFRDKVLPIKGVFTNTPIPTCYAVAWADLTGKFDLTAAFLNNAAHCRIIAVHDYMRSNCEGATRAVDEFIQRTNPRHVSVTETLIVIER